MTLFFTEIYWDKPDARLFNISANNKTVVIFYDIYAAAGERSPMQHASLRNGIRRASHEASQSLEAYSMSTQRRCRNQDLPMTFEAQTVWQFSFQRGIRGSLLYLMPIQTSGIGSGWALLQGEQSGFSVGHPGFIWLLTMSNCQNRWPGCGMQPDVPRHAGPAGAAGIAVQRRARQCGRCRHPSQRAHGAHIQDPVLPAE